MKIANALEGHGVKIEHIFAEKEEDQRAAKMAFWPGVAMLKGSTSHSFKGWESRALVIVTDDDAHAAAVLAYVALSRVKGDPSNRPAFVTVVNTVAELAPFKERFERPIGPDEVAALAGQTRLDIG